MNQKYPSEAAIAKGASELWGYLWHSSVNRFHGEEHEWAKLDEDRRNELERPVREILRAAYAVDFPVSPVVGGAS